MEYQTIIGLEVHVQLLTSSKMFCRCSSAYADAPPNTHVCPVCLGMPGVLPTINRQAVEYTAMTALALHCTIPEHTKFDRKNYPYPDLMKGYQISQYDAPIGINGWLDIETDGGKERIGITRVHLEEDTAKLFHRTSPHGDTYSLVDVNRSGVPLMEIVSEPDMRSPEAARRYLMDLRTILRYLGVSSGNMEEGSFRCDANISIRPAGGALPSVKVEVKNMNSFKAVYLALEYEEQRQRKVAEEGGRLVQETRGWVEERGVTVSQRSKEYAHDYRYFPEPDLPPLALGSAWVEEIRSRLPELPAERRERLMAQYGLSPYDAGLLTSSRAMADLFEAALSVETRAPRERRAKAASNWLLGEFSRLLNATGTDVAASRVTAGHLAEMLDLIDDGTLGIAAAKVVLEEMFHSGARARDVVAERGLAQISDEEEIEEAIARVIANNPQAVVDFVSGKGQALKFLVGQVMRETRGRADPSRAGELIKERIEESTR